MLDQSYLELKGYSLASEWFGRFGVPKELSSDGGPEFTAKETQEFLNGWGVKHRRSAAYFPQSNGRAEVAVKSAKRALRGKVDVDGTLNTDKMVKALLAIRNTPHPGCKKSPAEMVFNRKLPSCMEFSPLVPSGICQSLTGMQLIRCGGKLGH